MAEVERSRSAVPDVGGKFLSVIVLAIAEYVISIGFSVLAIRRWRFWGDRVGNTVTEMVNDIYLFRA